MMKVGLKFNFEALGYQQCVFHCFGDFNHGNIALYFILSILYSKVVVHMKIVWVNYLLARWF